MSNILEKFQAFLIYTYAKQILSKKTFIPQPIEIRKIILSYPGIK